MIRTCIDCIRMDPGVQCRAQPPRRRANSPFAEHGRSCGPIGGLILSIARVISLLYRLNHSARTQVRHPARSPMGRGGSHEWLRAAADGRGGLAPVVSHRFSSVRNAPDTIGPSPALARRTFPVGPCVPAAAWTQQHHRHATSRMKVSRKRRAARRARAAEGHEGESVLDVADVCVVVVGKGGGMRRWRRWRWRTRRGTTPSPATCAVPVPSAACLQLCPCVSCPCDLRGARPVSSPGTRPAPTSAVQPGGAICRAAGSM